MQQKKRNEMLTGYENVIHWVMKRNLPLIQALRLEREDVFQDLCVEAIIALDRYDPNRGASCLTYLVDQLQYAVLNMKRKHKVHGMTGYDYREPVTFVPLNVDFDGRPLDAPSEEAYELVELQMFLSSIPEQQQTLITERVCGKCHRRKAENAAIRQALDTILNEYVRGAEVCG